MFIFTLPLKKKNQQQQLFVLLFFCICVWGFLFVCFTFIYLRSDPHFSPHADGSFVCSYFPKFSRFLIRSLRHFFFINVRTNAVNFLLNIAFAVSHRISYVVLSFSLISRKCFIAFLMVSMNSWTFSNMLFNFLHVYEYAVALIVDFWFYSFMV